MMEAAPIDRIPPALEREACETARKAAANPGWLKEAEGRLLFALAAGVPGEGAVVEIGSAEGKSTIWMASGLKAAARTGKLYAIDPHESYLGRDNTHDGFVGNMERAGVEDVVVGMAMTSEQASRGWDRPVRLLFVDGDHSYESVRLDCELWSRHLIGGGVIAFHDCLRANTGPTRVFFEQVVESNQYCDFSFRGSVGYAVKAGCQAHGIQLQGPGRRLLCRLTLRLFLRAVGERKRLPKPLVNLFRAMVPH